MNAHSSPRKFPYRLLFLVTVALVLAWMVFQPIVSDAIEAKRQADQYRPDREVRSRIARIERECRRLGEDSWAGEYYYGDGLGTNATIHLAPKSGFAFAWVGCTGLYGQNLGDVRGDGSQIFLECERENDPGGFGSIHTEFIHVPWGRRSYLIPPELMIAFGNDVRAGVEPRDLPWGPFMMRSGDEHRAADGLPTVPAEFSSALESPMISAQIVDVLDTIPGEGSYFDRTRVRLDLGRQGGAHRLMKLVLEWPVTDNCMCARIEEVQEHESLAGIHRSSEDPMPEIGWRFARSPD